MNAFTSFHHTDEIISLGCNSYGENRFVRIIIERLPAIAPSHGDDFYKLNV